MEQKSWREETEKPFCHRELQERLCGFLMPPMMKISAYFSTMDHTYIPLGGKTPPVSASPHGLCEICGGCGGDRLDVNDPSLKINPIQADRESDDLADTLNLTPVMKQRRFPLHRFYQRLYLSVQI